MQAKDIPDEAIYSAIESIIKRRNSSIGASRWDIGEAIGAPEKVLLAKLDKMVRRNKLNGCACGCRGDFSVRATSHRLPLSGLDPSLPIAHASTNDADCSHSMYPHSVGGFAAVMR
jgi:hypothetical protein